MLIPRLNSLRSKLGRRMLVVFISCALLPVGTVALLSYTQVTRQLHEQTQTRLWYASKSLGMTLYERLLFLESGLGTIERSLRTNSDPDDFDVEYRPTKHIEARFKQITLVPKQGGAIALLGASQPPPRLTSEQKAHLRSGQTLLLTQKRKSSFPRILMLRQAQIDGAGRALLIGQIKQGYLFGNPHDNNLPPSSEFCVFGKFAPAFYCSLEERRLVSEAARSEIIQSSSGHLEWKIGPNTIVGAYWSLFLKPRFRAGSWIVMVSEPRSNALAPMAKFHKTFPLILALTLCIVILFSLTQIRRNLVPLEELQKGTKQIAKQDFDLQLEIKSGDEFEELAQSFSTMAKTLGQQFRLNATRAEIDRSVLAALDLPTIVDRVLALAPEIFPCESLSLTLLDQSKGSIAQTYRRIGDSEQPAGCELLELAPEDLEPLESESDVLVTKSTEFIPSYLRALQSDTVHAFVLLPLRFKSELLGVLAFAVSDEFTSPHERLKPVRGIADQLAIALSNVRMIQQIHFLAFYDSLTGLPNRAFFRERLQQAIEDAARHESLLAVLVIDLDGFKRINDSLDHDQGDELLQEVASRVLQCVKGTESITENAEGKFGVDIARLGGDEFALMLSDIGDAQKAAQVAKRVLPAISAPLSLGSQEVSLTASIGITIYPLDGDNVETLLRNADVAMYNAKECGRDGFSFYRSAMNETAHRHLRIESKLRSALEEDAFRLHYQPIIDTREESIVGTEALIRWHDSELGLVAPDEFIRLAEDSGLIVRLGERVLRSACEQTVAWQSLGVPALRVSVNLSGRQLRERSLADTVQRALTDSGLRPEDLTLEITESALIRDMASAIDVLQQLKDLGAKLSIDDFGTGYSSLSYLKNFPIDHLKIDKSFVQDVASSREDAAMTSAIIAMGHGLGLKVIAEGVETRKQFAFLRKKKCDEVQGYLFGHAMPADDLAAYLRGEPAPPRETS